MKQQNSRPFLIAITGGIASGKTLVANWFKEKDFVVIFSDKLGHQILKQQKIIKQLIEKFGNEILKNDKIDRKKLAKIVFENTENLSFLNKLVHPKIRKLMQQKIDNSNAEFLIIEIPLLYENDLYDCFDLCVNISTTKDIQIKRLEKRDGINSTEAIKKISVQLPNRIRAERSDLNFYNNLTLDRLYVQLSKFLEYLNKFEKKKIKRLVEKK